MKLLTRVAKVTIAESCILKDGEEMYTKEETANLITNRIKNGADNIDVKVESIKDYEGEIEEPKAKEKEELRQQALIAGVELGKDYNLNVAPEDMEKYLEITGADKADTTEPCI